MSRMRRPLRGRVVLVVGAGDPAAQAVALHLSALGAALIAAGPDLDPVLATAGLAAASGSIARVIEAKSPPLLGAELIARATEALEPPTDVIAAASAFSPSSLAAAAVEALLRLLRPGAQGVVVEAAPPAGRKAFAEAVAARFVAAVGGQAADASPEEGGTGT